jgi:ABC-2 type transport system ATP-binding protein
VLSRIGYLSEEPDLPAWMRVGELLRYTRAFHPQWDDAYAAQLCREFGLSEGALLRTLSKGQKARAALVAALAYRPALLVLDEPSSGLDPLVRRDILAAIIRTIAEEGRTVLFSSHLLGEVEQVADRVAMIDGGRVLFSAELDAVKESHCRVTVRFPSPLTEPPAGMAALSWSGGGREWTALCAEPAPRLEARAAMVGGSVVDHSAVSLDEIFLAHAGRARMTGPDTEGR